MFKFVGWDKINKKKNIILMFHNKGMKLYGGNIKYVAEEIIKQKLPYQIYFFVRSRVLKEFKKKDNYGFPKEIKVIHHKRDLRKIAKKSKFIITDNFFITDLLLKGFKKTHQFIINTWHGSLGIKKIDLFDSPIFGKEYKNNRRLEFDATDVMVSNSNWESEIFKKDLHFYNAIKEFGHPKNDIFFCDKQTQTDIRNKVCNEMNLDPNRKIVLIAPTFLNELKLDCVISCYLRFFDFKKIKEAFDKKFNGDVQVLLRLHPEWENPRGFDKFMEVNSFLINATAYSDIQELLVSTDAMITDFSSCIFDFLFTRKPGFIFAPDRKHYEITKGLYFPLEESPFSVAEDNETLCKNIINFDNNLYQKRVDDFLKSRNVVDDGHASERVVKLIKEKIGVL